MTEVEAEAPRAPKSASSRRMLGRGAAETCAADVAADDVRYAPSALRTCGLRPTRARFKMPQRIGVRVDIVNDSDRVSAQVAGASRCCGSRAPFGQASRPQLPEHRRQQLGRPSGGCGRRRVIVSTGRRRTSGRGRRGSPRRRRCRGWRRRGSRGCRRRRATLMKPRVSPFSTARLTRVIGRVPTSTRRPEARASASVIPARPSGGSVKSA